MSLKSELYPLTKVFSDNSDDKSWNINLGDRSGLRVTLGGL